MSFTREIIEERRDRQIREVYDLISLLLSYRLKLHLKFKIEFLIEVRAIDRNRV